MQEKMLARLDKDGSGGLSLDELPSGSLGKAAAAQFTLADTDGSGEVTRSEIAAFRAEQKGAVPSEHPELQAMIAAIMLREEGG